ncbi:MAG: TRAFAC clade GTPase domain-containing protein [Bacteroidota bacterium]
MNDMKKHNILIIGGPNTGKTHFGIQLYERINSRQFEFKIDPKNRPSDLSIFEDGLKNIYNGKRAAHTETGANRSIELIITNEKNSEVKLAFPDYAGEQITSIVTNRKVNNLWQDYIEKSTSWVLFIRLNEQFHLRIS